MDFLLALLTQTETLEGTAEASTETWLSMLFGRLSLRFLPLELGQAPSPGERFGSRAAEGKMKGRGYSYGEGGDM